MIHRRPAFQALILSAFLPATAMAESDKAPLCTSGNTAIPPWISKQSAIPYGQTTVSADSVTALPDGDYHLQGDVHISRNKQHLAADDVTYNQHTEQLTAHGNIQYWTQTLLTQGNHANLNIANGQGEISNVNFEMLDHQGFGKANHATLLADRVTKLDQVSYSTCPPQQQDWVLRAKNMTLDQQKGTGQARDVLVTFKRVPIFYTPWMSFPLSDARKTGFLPLAFRQSEQSGSELQVPYYINLAPNYDLTLTPISYSQRGLQLLSEYRGIGYHHQETINASYLVNDRQYQDDRYYFNLDWQAAKNNFSSIIAYSTVSDADYFTNFGNSLTTSRITHLPQSLSVAYQRPQLTLSSRLQAYQTINPDLPISSRPYQRWPETRLSLRSANRQTLNYHINIDHVDFRHESKVRGTRSHIQPQLSVTAGNEGWFFTPTTQLNYTRYSLNDGSLIERTLPVTSIDSGIFLERYALNQDFLQTLEPRLFYLYAPYIDQSNIPIFDSGLPDFTFSQLFRHNRFNGIDRIGDSNQLTVAITNRLIHRKTGRQVAQASLGQIYYFNDQQMNLSGISSATPARSLLLGNLTFSPIPQLSLRSDLRINSDTQQIDTGSAQLTLKLKPRQQLDINYRYRTATLEQNTVSLLWPLYKNWHFMGRWHHSLRTQQTLETLAGIEYQSCCWSARVITRRHIADNLGTINNAIFIQLELKGLASLGQNNNIDNLLGNGILNASR